MKKLHIFIFISLFAFFCNFINPIEWQLYDFKQAAFKMMFPEEPALEVEGKSLQAKTVSQGTLYKVSATWGGQYNLAIADDLLQETESFINKSDAIETTKKITIQNYPAKEIRFKTVKGKAVIFRAMITPTQTFQFLIIRNNIYADEENVNKFFGSFVLTR